jgi:chloride channel 3/4/5
MLLEPYDLFISFVERARKNRGRLANTPCLFTARYQEPDDIDLAPEVHEDDEPEEYFASTTAGEGINFWPWVNKVLNFLSREVSF